MRGCPHLSLRSQAPSDLPKPWGQGDSGTLVAALPSSPSSPHSALLSTQLGTQKLCEGGWRGNPCLPLISRSLSPAPGPA